MKNESKCNQGVSFLRYLSCEVSLEIVQYATRSVQYTVHMWVASVINEEGTRKCDEEQYHLDVEHMSHSRAET